jgi:transposase-like protein
MVKPVTIQQFMAQFPDDDACLAHLFKLRYGADYECTRCGEVGKYKKLSKMPAYTCQCGEHVHPMSGTFFHRSHTPLQKWFYAMYLFTTTRHGVPAKELQRQLGVSYETAWRMGHEIRKYIGTVDGDPPLGGHGRHVEIDETMVGGKRPGKRGRGAAGKTTVMGMLERGGNVMTRIVENVRRATLEPHIIANVKKGSTVSTDELKSYAKLSRRGYKHGAVNHSTEEWVRDEHHVQGIEGFWSLLKRSIKGTHVHVSRKYLANYLVEFEYRWNERASPERMLPKLLEAL